MLPGDKNKVACHKLWRKKIVPAIDGHSGGKKFSHDGNEPIEKEGF